MQLAQQQLSAALIIERTIAEPERIAKILSTNGSTLIDWAMDEVHTNQNRETLLTQSIELLNEAISIAKPTQDYTNWSSAAINLADAYRQLGQFDKAINAAEDARVLAVEKLSRRPFEAFILEQQGLIFLDTKMPQKACDKFNAAITIANELSLEETHRKTNLNLLRTQSNCFS